MATAIKDTGIYFKTDKHTKKSFSNLCSELGLSVSTALDMILKSSVRNKEIPVELSLTKKPASFDEMSDKKLYESYKTSQKQIQNNEYLTHEEFEAWKRKLNNEYGV